MYLLTVQCLSDEDLIHSLMVIYDDSHFPVSCWLAGDHQHLISIKWISIKWIYTRYLKPRYYIFGGIDSFHSSREDTLPIQGIGINKRHDTYISSIFKGTKCPFVKWLSRSKCPFVKWLSRWVVLDGRVKRIIRMYHWHMVGISPEQQSRAFRPLLIHQNNNNNNKLK